MPDVGDMLAVEEGGKEKDRVVGNSGVGVHTHWFEVESPAQVMIRCAQRRVAPAMTTCAQEVSRRRVISESKLATTRSDVLAVACPVLPPCVIVPLSVV